MKSLINILFNIINLTFLEHGLYDTQLTAPPRPAPTKHQRHAGTGEKPGKPTEIAEPVNHLVRKLAPVFRLFENILNNKLGFE